MKKNKYEDILQNAKEEMDREVNSPEMWPAISSQIESNNNPIVNVLRNLWNNRKYTLSLVTGFLIILIIAGSLFFNNREQELISVQHAEEMAEDIDKDIYKAQKIYENVLARLEKNCTVSEIESKDALAQAYFDKLHTLDQLILDCKTALQENPYNPAIHKNLFFAYNEKIEVYNKLENLN
jgi:hypothetical protein